jgi:amino acid adenylation domain-containing protein
MTDADVLQGFRLSPQQKRLWLLRQGGQAYVAQCAIRLEGDIQADVLKQALASVVERQEILRTTFHRQPGMRIPVQVVLESLDPSWTVITLDGMDAQAQDARVEELLKEEGERPFDFEHGPLVRSVLVTLSNREAVMLLTLPSLCADASTLKNLLQEISRCYAQPTLRLDEDDEVIQYTQFAEWQNELIEDDEAQKQYWQDQIRMARSAPKIPLDRASGASRRFTPEAVVLSLHSETANRLRQVAATHDTSQAALLQACWQTLVYRLSGQSDVVIGCLADGRKHDILIGAFGLLAKVVPVHCHFEEGSTFTQVLRQLDERLSDANALQEYFTWDHAPEASGLESEQAFLPATFCFQESLTNFSAGKVSFSLHKQRCHIDRFAVQLSCSLNDDSLTLEFNYDAARFDARDVERLSRSFNALLDHALRDPGCRVDQLNIITEADRHQLLVDYNETAFEYPQDKCIHELFQEQVARTPDRTAVVFQEQSITYAELNARANQIAHHLRRRGAAPERAVALFIDRSIEMIVGLLGIIKSGSAYLPLDVDQPKARLGHMIKGAQVPILLTQRELVSRLPEFQGELICVDADQEFQREPAINPVNVSDAENLVYVIYTSGSTGVPKGVGVRHRGLVNYAHFMCDKLGLKLPADGEANNFATVSTMSADLGNTCIFPALLSGGCLHIVSYNVATDSKLFADYASDHRIEILKIVPSHFGGEPLSPDMTRSILAEAGDLKVINHYGPTETTIGSLVFSLREDDDGYSEICSTVPIGRPIWNTEVYLLDPYFEPVPTGMAGEVYVGGAGVARGYINQPDQTAARFTPDGSSRTPGARLYRTGDLARYLADGSIEFLGRVDHQVKTRGMRVETQELQAALSKYPGLQDVVIHPREDQPGEVRLVAYMTTEQKIKPTVTELRGFLSQALPEYMIPSAFVFLDRLPLSSNGKVDRNALPPPDQARPELEKDFVPPRTPVEEMLAGLWVEILGLDRAGVYDNFFELGGHSLLATRLMSRIRQVFEVELPLRQVFGASTIAELAENIETALREGQRFSAPRISPVSRDQQLPLSFAQERLWFLDHLQPDSGFYNCPAAVRIGGSLNVAGLESALGEVVRRHEVLRTTFQTVNGRPVQVIGPAQPTGLTLVDLEALTGTEREAKAARLAAEEARRPFDLSRGPLLRAALVRLGREDHLLLFTMHHIVSDGWSRGILVREVASLYDAFSGGTASPLADPAVQYADFAAWQRRYMRDEIYEQHLSYWKKQFDGAPPVLKLPADRPRASMQTSRGESQSLSLSENLAQDLKSLSRREGTTLFMTLLAGFMTLLYRYSGQEDVTVGTAVANRNRSETEDLIGFFVNMLAMRGDLSGNPTFIELLGRVREVTLGAYTHQDLPFEKIVEHLQLKRDASHHPLFQVVFALNNTPQSALELQGLKLSMGGGEVGTARFDMTLNMVEMPGELSGVLDYNADLFDAETISRLLDHYRILLEGIVAHPDWNLLDFELTAGDRAAEPAAQPQSAYEADSFIF